MNGARERAFLPMAVPIGILVVIAGIVLGFSRILLNVPPTVAVAVALMAALNVLGFFSALSARPNLDALGRLLLLGVVAVPFAIGIAAAAGILPMEEAKEEHAAEPVTVEVSAKNVAFDSAELSFPAGADVTMKFTNGDTVPHNVSIYEGTSASGAKVFIGEIFTGPSTKSYSFKAPKAGSYYFQCDVHPNMNGTVTVSEHAGGGEAEGGGESAKISAKNVAFDAKELELAADKDVTIDFENAEAIPHNVSVHAGSDARGEKVFTGEIFSGPATRQYRFKAPKAGSYYFQCDVHPTMNGRITFR